MVKSTLSMLGLQQIIGQESAIAALRSALKTAKLPGAYLLTGTAGTGRSFVATALAQAAMCLEPTSEPFDACGVCASCKLFLSGTHPDITHISAVGEKIQIWQLWDRDGKPPGILSRTLRYSPTVGAKRVYILHDVEKFTPSAANSILKVLEEPPSYVMFILLAMDSARTLPTITSRCTQIRLSTVSQSQLEEYLQGNLSLTASDAAIIAAYSEGRIGQAVQMANNPNVMREINEVLAFSLSAASAPLGAALKVAEQMRKLAGQMKATVQLDVPDAAEEGEGSTKERAARFQFTALFELLMLFYRDLLMLSATAGNCKIAHPAHRTEMISLSQRGGPFRWQACLEAILIAQRRLEANASISLITEVLSMSLLECPE